jgi:serine/threonine-protein kinase
VAALRHPHIVQVYDFDVEDDLYYMVMEFVDGGTLKERLQELARAREYLPLSEVARIVGEIAEALKYAHGQGMIHRDVKPANVLLNRAGRAFLTDFGIARILSSGTQFTATGTLIGTPAYMSPEQGKGLPLTETSDIYSLGVILYELVTGRVPYEADTPLAIIHQHVHEPLPTPRSLRSEIPEALDQVILKALTKDPKARFQDAAGMQRAVHRALAAEAPAPPVVAPDEQPTALWQPEAEPAPPVEEMPTVAMEEAPLAEARPVSPQERPVTSVATASTEAMEERSAPPAPPEPAAAPQPQREAGRREKRRVSPVALGAGVLAIVVVLVIAVSQLSGGASCGSIEECHGMAEDLSHAGDLGGAIEMLEEALGQVSDDEHPAHAELWCQRGDFLREIGDIDAAIASYEECIGWTEGVADLEWLRAHAEECIMELGQQ